MEMAKAYKQPVPQVPDEVVSQAANALPKRPLRRTPGGRVGRRPVADIGTESNYSPTEINDANDQSGFDATQMPLPRNCRRLPPRCL